MQRRDFRTHIQLERQRAITAIAESRFAWRAVSAAAASAAQSPLANDIHESKPRASFVCCAPVPSRPVPSRPVPSRPIRSRERARRRSTEECNTAVQSQAARAAVRRARTTTPHARLDGRVKPTRRRATFCKRMVTECNAEQAARARRASIRVSARRMSSRSEWRVSTIETHASYARALVMFAQRNRNRSITRRLATPERTSSAHV